RKLLGLTGGDYTKIFLGLVVGLVSAGIIAWWNSKQPHLRYAVSDPIQHQGEKLKIGIINIVIINDGNKEAENLKCNLRLNGTAIQDVKVSPEHLKASVTVTNNKFDLTLPMLNPGESLQISTCQTTVIVTPSDVY